LIWLKFAICLVIILFAGTRLARYGDTIAEKTGLGRIWVGMMFLATITSVPELVTGVSSAALVGLPDMGLGTLLGSCLFNISIIALLDILHRSTPVLSRTSSRQIILAGLGILLLTLVAGGILTGTKLPGFSLGWVGIPSLVTFIVYLVAMRWIFRLEQSNPLPSSKITSPQYAEVSLKLVYIRFILAAIAVISAGIWLSFIGDEIAQTTGWGATFVGSLVLAIGTSLPELVVAIAALRLGAIDMAVANILGSNILDIACVFIIDLFYIEGPVLSSVSSNHLITSALLIVMNLLVIIGLRFRQERKTFIVFSWYAPALILLYAFGAYALFVSGTGPS